MKLDIDKLDIGKILNYSIDPFNSYKLLKRELKEVSKSLEERFFFGYELLDNFQQHVNINNYGGKFANKVVRTRYDLLDNLMSSRPKNMVSKLKKFYRIYHKGEQTHNRKHPLKRTGLDTKYIELCLYTHKWRQKVEKKDSKEDQSFYQILKNTKFDRCNLLIQNNPNQNHIFHSVFQRQKSKKSIIDKLISKTMQDIETTNIYPKRFYNLNYNIKDFFAMRICSPRLGRRARAKINELITYEGQLGKRKVHNNEWISINKVDYTKNNDININHIKHYLRTVDYPIAPLIEVQFSTLEDMLLDEFFTASGHLLKERKRKSKLKKGRKKNSDVEEIQKRVKGRLDIVLDFLD